jgi:hypothetical protein
MSRLLHYCQFEMTGPVPDYEQPSGLLTVVDMKPKGLWVSVEGEDDWKTWCEANHFNLHRFTHCYEIRLTRTAKVLWIKTGAQFRKFNSTYTTELYGNIKGIDWPRVSEEFDGLIIAPYQWKFRHDFQSFWYYGWDCASGCIWKPAAIESIELIKA